MNREWYLLDHAKQQAVRERDRGRGGVGPWG